MNNKIVEEVESLREKVVVKLPALKVGFGFS